MLRQVASFVSRSSSSFLRREATGLSGWRSCRPLSTAPSLQSNSDNTTTTPTLTIETNDGRKFAVLDSKKLPPLKPYIVKRRLGRLKQYRETEHDIRHSSWKLNLICELIRGLTVTEAFLQLKFCEKTRAALVSNVLRRAVNQAAEKDGLQPSQLEVATCFSTKGKHLKRIRYHARGRFGTMRRPKSHMQLVIREIDFKLKLYQEKSYNQKKKWLNLQLQAERDAAEATTERDELAELEARQKEIEEQAEKAEEK